MHTAKEGIVYVVVEGETPCAVAYRSMKAARPPAATRPLAAIVIIGAAPAALVAAPAALVADAAPLEAPLATLLAARDAEDATDEAAAEALLATEAAELEAEAAALLAEEEAEEAAEVAAPVTLMVEVPVLSEVMPLEAIVATTGTAKMVAEPLVLTAEA